MMAKLSVRRILQGRWQKFLSGNYIDPNQRREVEKMLNCARSSCNSRLCTGCGKRHADAWAKKISDSLLPFAHSHVVLTIPSYLRPYLRDWTKLKAFMDASYSFSGAFSC